MKEYRENPDGDENQRATRDNERYVGGLKLQHQLMKPFEPSSYGPIRKAEIAPGNGYKYVVLAIPVQGKLDAEALGAVTDGTLIVECFYGHAYLFSPNGLNAHVSVRYVSEKLHLIGEHAHAVAAVIAALLNRDTDSKFAKETVV